MNILIQMVIRYIKENKLEKDAISIKIVIKMTYRKNNCDMQIGKII